MAANNFNFDSYNGLIKTAPTGLRLHLGIQLIRDVVSSLEHFDNPLEAELRPILHDLKTFHQMYKDRAAEIKAKKENESERTASIDNSTVPTTGVQDMMKMMQEQQKLIAALLAGNNVAAHNAQQSVEQIQNGVLHQQGDTL